MARRGPSAPLGAVLGPDAHHQGDLSFEGRVRIDGRFTGRLYSEDTLEIGASGAVHGDVDVACAVIAGSLEGTLRVRERLVLEPTARIKASVDAGIVELRAGARLEGQVRITGAAPAP